MLNVKQRQLALRTYYYYYTGAIDGITGSGTAKAIKNFQRNNGLAPDGIYGEKTDNQLRFVISNCQGMLRSKGYDIAQDGIVGDATIGAIKDFQSRNGLTVDGIIGDATFSKLSGDTPTPGITWDDIKHFQPGEMTCKCGCGQNNTDLRLMQVLEQARAYFGGKPTIITSGCRCPKHNAEVGGVAGSQHIFGKGADFYIQGVPTASLLNYCRQLVNNGTLAYTYTNNTSMNGVVHINI